MTYTLKSRWHSGLVISLALAAMLLAGAGIEKLKGKKQVQAEAETPDYESSDLSIVLKAEIDLATARSSCRYTIRNRGIIPVRLNLHSPLFGKTEKLDIAKRASQDIKAASNIKLSRFSEKTWVAVIRPYLLREDDEKLTLLPGLYDIDVDVKIPNGSRIIKSSVALMMKSGTLAIWKYRNGRTIPPIYIWFTSNPRDVEIKKVVLETVDESEVRIEIANISSTTVNGLFLKSQIPKTLFEPIFEKSDGEFVQLDVDMAEWHFKLEKLYAGESKTVHYSILKLQTGVG
ncbi:MAG: hypothetical protein NTW95_03920, partial [Candidatus Aminicenantes bacterium]|nr:hypothetical protein [Candidatus Aminicenantes bacterium]